jgi:hypothetical protein
MSLTARTIYTVGAGRERSHGREAMTMDQAAIIAGFGFDTHSAAPDLSDLDQLLALQSRICHLGSPPASWH